MAVSVSLKWGKQKFDLAVDTADSAEVFMAQVYALTGVPLEKQKILAKGTTIKPTTDLATLKLKDGAVLMLMGGAEAVAAPAQSVVFSEDLSEDQLVTASSFPPGLENFGNTCYLNASIQCLRGAPELEAGLTTGGAVQAAGTTRSFANSLSTLFKAMKQSDGSHVRMATMMMVQALRSHNPRFAEEQEEGHFVQQDAGEALGEILRTLTAAMPGPANAALVEQLFGVRMATKLKCIEQPEDSAMGEETALQLSCHIEKDVGFMMSGIKHALKDGKLMKRSAALGRDAEYTKEAWLSRLPAYLMVNFVRFFFKKEEKTNCKIIKDVKFPFLLDVFELCSPELQAKLSPQRTEFAKYADYLADQQQKVKDKKQVEAEKKAEQAVTYHPFSFAEDPGSNNSGYYDLVAVLTHKGRSSDSGHYVCWRRVDEKQWLLFDDERVTPVTREDVEKLSGGGADWHTAYYLLYAPRKLPVYTAAGAAAAQ